MNTRPVRPKGAQQPRLTSVGPILMPDGVDAVRLAMLDSQAWLVIDVDTDEILEVSPWFNELYGVEPGYFVGTKSAAHLEPNDYETEIKPYHWQGETESSAKFRYGPDEQLVRARWRLYRDKPTGRLRCFAVHEDLREQARLREQAEVHSLTGLASKSVTEATVARRMDVADTPFAVFMGDLDLFKRVNDTHGHLVGDEVLRETGKRLRNGVREARRDFVGIIGGEEFLGYLHNPTVSGVENALQRLKSKFHNRPIETTAGLIPVTMSFGAVRCEPGQYTFAEAKQLADDALYQSKHGGRDRYTLTDQRPALYLVGTGDLEPIG